MIEATTVGGKIVHFSTSFWKNCSLFNSIFQLHFIFSFPTSLNCFRYCCQSRQTPAHRQSQTRLLSHPRCHQTAACRQSPIQRHSSRRRQRCQTATNCSIAVVAAAAQTATTHSLPKWQTTPSLAWWRQRAWKMAHSAGQTAPRPAWPVGRTRCRCS